MEYPGFNFKVTAKDPKSRARCGILTTPHGTLETPAFIFCATRGAIKGLTAQQVREAGADIILANTYHMMLQPGAERVAKLGGLQKFTGWNGPMLTDSGGFQIFSLGHGGVADEIKGRREGYVDKTLLKITEEGACFRSYIDGSKHWLTPEISISVQQNLGADIILTLDECTPFHSGRDYTARSMERSHRWEKRSLDAFERTHNGTQALYGIVQGGIYEDLRQISGQFVAEQPFFGQAIGGSLGGTKEEMHTVVEMASRYIHPERPTHLLGIGGISDIWHGVRCGIDTFDCVHPTRIARHGGALRLPTHDDPSEHMNLNNARYRDDTGPIDPSCTCACCRHYARGYIHHLLKARETTAGVLLSIHNIATMVRVVQEVRQSIRAMAMA